MSWVEFLCWWFASNKSLIEVLRNFFLAVGVPLGLGLAVWRSLVAQKQAKISHRQAETSYNGLLNERYQKGAEMLGSKVPSTRLAGIYALRRLAEEHRKQYHVQILRLFCAFVRNPFAEDPRGPGQTTADANPEAEVGGIKRQEQLREDIQAIMDFIGARDEAVVQIEKKEGYRANLRGANLHGADLIWADLLGANLHGADLIWADLTGANLLQGQLDSACAKPGRPPTGIPDGLKWTPKPYPS